MADQPLTEEQASPVLEPTPIYRCKQPECKAWVREEYASEDKACPLCKEPMARSIKHLPVVQKPKRKRSSKKS
ncbi:cold-inducible protein YdjO-related protein [Paenibacillus gansuensis]|uniref:Cold-inducible protein YdjO-related protein n=1 Tax=Paenibacillus gansuensis TaxID=306542 RepID=A0ABW5PF54_9BACL